MGMLGARGTSLLMSYTVTEKKIQKIIEKKQILPMSLLEYVAPGNAKVAAVQLEVRRYQKLNEYIDDMESYIFDSLQKTCHMICFPELTGMLPISLAPECRKDTNLLDAMLSPTPEKFTTREMKRFYAQLRQCSNFLFECFYTTFSALARRYAAYICAGGPYVEDGGRYYNRAYLFSPQGEVELVQDKLQPGFLESKLGIRGGSSIEVKKTLIGNVALAIGSDSAYYEYHKIAASLGADMVIASSGPWERLQSVSDVSCAQLRALESGLYTVCSSIESGKAGVFAPFSRTRDGSGIAAQAGALTGREPVVSRLYLDKRVPELDVYADDRNPDCYAALLSAAGYEPESRAVAAPERPAPRQAPPAPEETPLPEPAPAPVMEAAQEESKAPDTAQLWGVDKPEMSAQPLWDEHGSASVSEEVQTVAAPASSAQLLQSGETLAGEEAAQTEMSAQPLWDEHGSASESEEAQTEAAPESSAQLLQSEETPARASDVTGKFVFQMQDSFAPASQEAQTANKLPIDEQESLWDEEIILLSDEEVERALAAQAEPEVPLK